MSNPKPFNLQEASALINANIKTWVIHSVFDPINNELILSTPGNFENGQLYDEIEILSNTFYKSSEFKMNLNSDGVRIKKLY